MKDLITYLVTHIVDHPQDVTVDEQIVSERSYQYLIHAHTDDTGKIIGKNGKIIQAIRSIAKVLAVKEGIQVRIEIV